MSTVIFVVVNNSIMSIDEMIKSAAADALAALYSIEINQTSILVNTTKPEFESDYTIVLFSFIKKLKKTPEAIGNEMGNYLVEHNNELFKSFNVIKGFLNLTISDAYLIQFSTANYNNINFGKSAKNDSVVMVEYSSPNTNKPLHLGHLRNIFLGWSIAEILKFCGHDVIKTCVVNDRGIHINKSMIAWQLFGNGATPENTGKKGDHLVGDYYVKFNEVYQEETAALIENGTPKEQAAQEAPLMQTAREMLIDWEAGKPAIIELWQKMNSWVYKGFEETYKRIGADFDKVYYESQTYLLGKNLIEKGLEKNVFFSKEDSSVWIDLTADGLDEKIVQRKDGTSVYITQDIGLAEQKEKEYNMQQSIYVVGDEQNYHFKVLKLICQKLGLPAAEGIQHVSYGMVELPSGKMKSREGTVVDADDLLDEMIQIAEQKTEELGKIKDFAEEELKQLYDTIGIGALKFFILRVDPKKRMVFNPEESIDIHGFTAPFIQYTYARIKSILRKENNSEINTLNSSASLLPLEKELLITAEKFPAVIKEAAAEYDPSKIAIYVFNLAKLFNSFYTEHSVSNAESEEKKILRLQLCTLTAHIIKTGLHLLGIDAPERM